MAATHVKQDRETGGWKKRLVLLTRKGAKTHREARRMVCSEGVRGAKGFRQIRQVLGALVAVMLL